MVMYCLRPLSEAPNTLEQLSMVSDIFKTKTRKVPQHIDAVIRSVHFSVHPLCACFPAESQFIVLCPCAHACATCDWCVDMHRFTNVSKQPLPGKQIGPSTSGTTVHGSGKESRTFGGRWVYGPTSFFGRGRRPPLRDCISRYPPPPRAQEPPCARTNPWFRGQILTSLFLPG